MEFEIKPYEVLTQLLPMLTNIYIDVDDQELLDSIYEDPSETLLDVQEEINQIVREVAKRFTLALEQVETLDKESMDKLMDEIANNEH